MELAKITGKQSLVLCLMTLSPYESLAPTATSLHQPADAVLQYGISTHYASFQWVSALWSSDQHPPSCSNPSAKFIKQMLKRTEIGHQGIHSRTLVSYCTCRKLVVRPAEWGLNLAGKWSTHDGPAWNVHKIVPGHYISTDVIIMELWSDSCSCRCRLDAVLQVLQNKYPVLFEGIFQAWDDHWHFCDLKDSCQVWNLCMRLPIMPCNGLWVMWPCSSPISMPFFSAVRCGIFLKIASF